MMGRDADRNDVGWALVRRVGFTGLLETIVDRRARTERARARGRTIAVTTAALARSGVTGEITVVEGDGTHWSVAVAPGPAVAGNLTEGAGA
jgi:hypothetical protein